MIYLDTSALAKAYMPEARSSDVDELLLRESGNVAISELAILEMRCTVSRRTRERVVSAEVAAQVWSTFQDDVADGLFTVVTHSADDFRSATRVIETIAPIPLKTLDALHLAFARRASATQFASADKQQLAAASALGFQTIPFLP